MNDLKNQRLTIFIATPITRKLGKPKEIARLRLLVDSIDAAAQEARARTLCAFREEGWRGEEDPSVFVHRDFRWCRECHGAVLLPEDSYGVRVELGWLSALQKPILRLHDGEIRHQTGLERSLGHVCTVFDQAIRDPCELTESVRGFIAFIRGKTGMDFGDPGLMRK